MPGEGRVKGGQRMVEVEEEEFIEVKTWRCPGEEGRKEDERREDDAEQAAEPRRRRMERPSPDRG